MSLSTPRDTPPTFKFDYDKRDGQVLLLTCPDCKRFTNHEVIKSVQFGWERYNYELHGYDEYLIVKCNGCNRPSYLTMSTNSEDMDEDGPVETRIQYPHTDITHAAISIPHSTPTEVRAAYDETSKALSAGLDHLGAVGIRLIAELICKAEGAQGNDLFEQIDALYEMKLISQSIADSVHGVRFLGNDAVHEFEVRDYQLTAAWQAIGSLISYIYGSQDNSDYLLTPGRRQKLEEARTRMQKKREKSASTGAKAITGADPQKDQI